MGEHSGDAPIFMSNTELARKTLRGRQGYNEKPLSAREERRLRERMARRAAKAKRKS